jgi:AbrB family looped-hinge helix DNA binding protein
VGFLKCFTVVFCFTFCYSITMQKVKLSGKNQIVIPKSVRGKLHLAGGDELIVDKITKNSVVFKKAPSYHDLRGVIKPQKKDAVNRVRELRKNWK